MADGIPLRLRRLPDGEFRQGVQVGWDNPQLQLTPEPDGGFSIGDLLEIECGSMLYFGELLRWDGPAAVVLVEHRLDRSTLPAIQEAWG